MKAWLRLISVGVIGGLLASACVITSDDDGDDENGEGGEGGDESTGGRRPTGGASTGGRATGGTGTGGATGGTASTTGGTSTGGAATGGKGMDECEVEEFEPAETCGFDDDTDACTTCLSSACCDEIKSCFATEPLPSRCGYGATEDEFSDFECARNCLLEIGDIPTQEDIDLCVGGCMSCGEVTTLDNAYVTQCMADNCYEECLAP
jgi:hypothetical protein